MAGFERFLRPGARMNGFSLPQNTPNAIAPPRQRAADKDLPAHMQNPAKIGPELRIGMSGLMNTAKKR
jgi:hypothetical protein